jgi:hypothetical protein
MVCDGLAAARSCAVEPSGMVIVSCGCEGTASRCEDHVQSPAVINHHIRNRRDIMRKNKNPDDKAVKFPHRHLKQKRQVKPPDDQAAAAKVDEKRVRKPERRPQ